MKRSKDEESLVKVIEKTLSLGEFISYGRSWDFINKLEEVKSKIDDLVRIGEAKRAVSLYEVFLSGCYEKAEEIDDSGGNLGMFAQKLFISWIVARQKAGCHSHETVKHILRWMHNDDYGFCYAIEQDVAQVLDADSYLLFRKHFEDHLELALASFKDQEPKCIHDYPYEVYRSTDALKAIYIARKDVRSYLALCEKTITSPKDCENIAKLYEMKRRFADALAWIEKGLALEDKRQWGNESSSALMHIKCELLSRLGRKEDALRIAWSEFQRYPSIYSYEELMKCTPSKESRQWHTKAIHEARKASLSAFIEICVKTDEWEILSKRIALVKHEELEQISHYVTEKAAQGLVVDHEWAAAKIYRALAMRIIKSSKSKYYQYALEHFQRAKELYEKSGQDREWSFIVARVREDHSRKYSFIGAFEAIAAGEKLESPESFESRVQKRWRKQISEFK